MNNLKALPKDKFSDPHRTAKGETRAWVKYQGTKTLWFNTGTLCNIECLNCYIESSPTNDRLVYLTVGDVIPYLEELALAGEEGVEIGFTGGEPFLAPDMVPIIEAVVSRGYNALVLTNAMKPLMRKRVQNGLKALQEKYNGQIRFRVSLDHYSEELHNVERGRGAFEAASLGLSWLATEGFELDLAGRTVWGEDEDVSRAGYAKLIDDFQLGIDPADTSRLVLFPEMKETDDPPEITNACWGILDKSPSDQMCSNSRMVVKRKGADKTAVVACTLIAYDERFEMGHTLKEARKSVSLNHPYCATFCVLGGGSCSA
jgi:hypothetical protein